MSVVVRIDEAALNRFLNEKSGPLARHLLVRGRRVETIAKGLCGVQSGRLRASIRTELVFGAPGGLSGVGPIVFVGSNLKYALYHEEGTGIYGPRNSPIVREGGGLLSWVDRATGERVFARSVKGSPGKHFLLSALETERGRGL